METNETKQAEIEVWNLFLDSEDEETEVLPQGVAMTLVAW